jgi:hypothetical protein
MFRDKRVSFAMALALVVALSFMGVPSAGFAAGEVDVSGAASVAAVQAAIQDEIDAVAGSGGGEVAVVGSYDGADGNLVISIPVGVKVVWQAYYHGAAARLVDLGFDGEATAGTLEVRDGDIVNSADSGIAVCSTNTAVIVSGGTVRAEGQPGTAIRNETALTQVTDGTVSSTGIGTQDARSVAIASTAGDIVVEGSGTVLATGDFSAAVRSTSGSVTVASGSSVSASAVFCYGIFIEDDGSVTIEGGSVAVTGDNSMAVYSQAGTVLATAGVMNVAGSSSYGIATHRGEIVLAGTLVSVTRGGSIGLYSDFGPITMTAGAIIVSGDGSNGIRTNFAGVCITGGSIECESDYATGVGVYDGSLATGGEATISATGSDSIAVALTGSGSAVIQGAPGSVSATGSDSYALLITASGSGVIAYLADAVVGAIGVQPDTEAGVDHGLIIVVDSLEIAVERGGTKLGLTVAAIGADTASTVDYLWDTTSLVLDADSGLYGAVIAVEGVNQEIVYQIFWAPVASAVDPGDEGDGGNGDQGGTVTPGSPNTPARPATTGTATPRTGESALAAATAMLACVCVGGWSLALGWRRRQTARAGNSA